MPENIDIYCLVEWIDPDWRDHFGHIDQAVACYTHPRTGMSPKELRDAINESGARHDG